ncbi:MAG: hypothetical protein Q9221_007698, partial [Calogaya cf. arnoldii]
MYIVNSFNLVSAVDRQAKTLSFDPFGVEISKRLILPTPEGLEAMKVNLHTENRSWGFRPETMKAMHYALAPGPDLENITRAFLRSALSFPGPVSGMVNDEEFPLFDYGKKLVTRANTDAVFGESSNPFRDPAVVSGF